MRGHEQSFPNWHYVSGGRHPACSQKRRAKLAERMRPARAGGTEHPGRSVATFAFVLAYSQHPEIRIWARFMKTNGLKSSNRNTFVCFACQLRIAGRRIPATDPSSLVTRNSSLATAFFYSSHPGIRILPRLMKTNGLESSNRHTLAFFLDAFSLSSVSSVSSVLSLCLPAPTSPKLLFFPQRARLPLLLSLPRHNSRTGVPFSTSPRFTFAGIGTTIVPDVVPEESRGTGSLRSCRRHNPSHDHCSLADAICASRHAAVSSRIRRTARVRLCGTRGGAR